MKLGQLGIEASMLTIVLVLTKRDWILQKFLKNRDKGDKMKPQKSSLHFVRLGCHLLQQQQKTSQGEKKLQQRDKKIRK